MSLATLTAGLRLNIADFASKLKEATRRYRAFTDGISGGYISANVALRSHSLQLRDVSRIVQGIVISQTFYAGVNAIREATSALSQFNEQLDYAKVTYSAVFGDTKMATDFVKVLQQYAVDTIFEYQDLSEMSKKLMAYGIEYENLMYIMEGLTNLGAMSGDAAALDRIALALGQIQTTGYLAATEMRQLANAYVPIYDIVQESFGLTGEQMQSVGDLKLPAHEVINAVVEYANAKFGTVGDAAMLTITGLKNRVIDTVKVLGSEMTQPLTTAWKSFLMYISEGLAVIRELYKQGGTGALFEALVPDPEVQTTVRAFFANLHNSIMSIMSALAALKPVVGIVAQAFMVSFNIIAPVVTMLGNYLSALVKVIAENSAAAAALRAALVLAAGAFVVFKVQAISAMVVTALTKAVATLVSVLKLLALTVLKHPILMLLAGLAIALVGVAAASNNANNSLTGLFKKMSQLGGSTTQEDIFKDITTGANDTADALDQFNNPLEGSKDAAEELGDAINGAGKEAEKARGLLSFDEVFKLNDDKSSSAGSGSDAVADIESLISGLGGLGDALIPEVPDFTSFIDEFTNDLFGGLAEKMMAIASGGATGALIGGLAGFAIGALVTRSMSGALAGAKLGTKIGAIAGTAFATFWTDSYKSMEETLQGVALGGSAGLIVGALAGFIIGAFSTNSLAGAIAGARLGSTLGAIAGGAVGGVFGAAGEELEKQIKQIAYGTAEGALLGAVAGMIIGAFATKSIGGAMAGAKWGVALGSALGAPLDAIFGNAEAALGERMTGLFKDVSAASYGSLIGGLLGMIIGAIVGALAGGVGAIPGAKAGAMLGSAIGGLGGLIVSYFERAGITEAIGVWFTNLGKSIAKWFGDAWNAVTDWSINTWDSIVVWTRNTDEAIREWIIDTYFAIDDWCADVRDAIIDWTQDTRDAFVNWCTNVWTNIRNWTVNTAVGIANWAVDTAKRFFSWSTETITGFGKWVADTFKLIFGWGTDTSTTFKDWITNTAKQFADWFSNTLLGFISWWGNVLNVFTEFVTKIREQIYEKFGQADRAISDFLGLETSIGTFCSNALKSIKNFASGIWDSISDRFSKAIEKIKEYINIVKEAASIVGDKLANTGVGKVVSGVTDFVGGLLGHASGGIFDREHIARFAEGNKAEAIIPLENARAMQPFVDAVSNGILGSIAPVLAQGSGGYGNANQLQPLYVGTLIADDRGLKELYKRFEVIQIQEDARRGNTR